MAGMPAPGMELVNFDMVFKCEIWIEKIVDPDNFDKEMKKNGKDTGELLIQGNILQEYFPVIVKHLTSPRGTRYY